MTIHSLTIFFATETGTGEEIASNLRDEAKARGLEVRVADLAETDVSALLDIETALFVASTTGEGDAPYAAESFFDQVGGGDAPCLDHLRYAVLALGDSSYAQFCAAGLRLDEDLLRLGATRLVDRIDCDVDYDESVARWRDAVFDALAVPPVASTASAQSSDSQPAQAQKYRTTEATVVENRRLTGSGSTKAVRHIALAFTNADVTYEPGDALGIIVENDPQVVADLLEATRLAAQLAVEFKGERLSLCDVLRHRAEITTATPRFLEFWAALSDSSELGSLLDEGRAAERVAFLHDHHIVDIVRRYPVEELDAQVFIQSLRPLQPRLYSIASSMRVSPGEVHLTVAPVCYELRGEVRKGVATSQLCERTPIGLKLQIYTQTNRHFRLPQADVPIIMIGAGTGIAPYRGFLQERGTAAGPAWLFFGERNRASDFLYEAELNAFLKSGALTRLDTAFSRDSSEKVYVQHRMLDQCGELARWIQNGAHVYVCGDAEYMAPDVHNALIRAIELGLSMSVQEAEAYIATMQREGRYQRDVY